MGLNVKYSPVLVKDPGSVQQFLTDVMGYVYSRKVRVTNEVEAVIMGTSGDARHFIMLIGDEQNSDGQIRIILCTEDCLKEYYRLLDKGVNFSTKPQYTELGLAVNLTDPSGNLYMLLEERTYEDN